MSTLRIHLFEKPRLYDGDQQLPDFPTIKTQYLFCYLVLRRKRCHPRSMLASLFWGDCLEEHARKSLRTTLWRLRSLLDHFGAPGPFLIVKNDEIGFDLGSDYWLDIEEFEQRLERCSLPETRSRSELQDPALTRSLQDTVNLYQGDLLEGCYEDWCLYERERLQGMFLNALTQLMVCYRTQGNYDQAIDCGQRILSYDPLMEEIHREMMSLYAVAGHRGAALRQYRLCREVLARELKIAPMEETDALYAQICNGTRLPDQSQLLFDTRRAAPSAGPPQQQPDYPPSLQYVHDALSELQLVQAELQLLNVHFQKGVHALETCCQRLLH